MVGAGIFLSRIAGFIRQRTLAHFFGDSDAADVFYEALKIPNLLQNLFGEGVLSASLIPVYASLIEKKEEEEARRVAGAVATLLFFTTSLLVAVGVIAAPLLVDGLAPGFEGEKRDATVRLVRILFPGTGMLVMSAWCLGILNSHRRFFLSYVAPVLWNAAIIGALVFEGSRGTDGYPLAEMAAWGAVAGSALQLFVQVPTVLTLLGGFRAGLGRTSANVGIVVRNFVPVVVGRGVVQISSYVDGILASLLPTGSVAAIGYAQLLYQLPVSLFGMSVSASELPEMSRQTGSEEEIAAKLRVRLESGLRRIAFFVVPSAVAFLALGDVLIAFVYRTGEFDRGAELRVWAVLAGYAFGLVPSTMARLYSSTFYALRDTRTPLRIALARVAVGTIAGWLAALHLPALLGYDEQWGVAGITLAASLAAFTEFALLRVALRRRLGTLPSTAGLVVALTIAALLAAAAGWGVRWFLPEMHPALAAVAILGPFGVVYFTVTAIAGVRESRDTLGKIMKRIRR